MKLNFFFKAVESASKIGSCLSPAQVEEHYIPMLKRLTGGDWFTSRTSACGLYTAIYQLSSPATQDELRRYVFFLFFVGRNPN